MAPRLTAAIVVCVAVAGCGSGRPGPRQSIPVESVQVTDELHLVVGLPVCGRHPHVDATAHGTQVILGASADRAHGFQNACEDVVGVTLPTPLGSKVLVDGSSGRIIAPDGTRRAPQSNGLCNIVSNGPNGERIVTPDVPC
jgi:hypothetical protein